MSSNSTEWPLGGYTYYYREILSFLTGKLRCPEEAADVAHDSFLRLLTTKDPHTVKQPRAFLYRIARNLAVDSAGRTSITWKHVGQLGLLAGAPTCLGTLVSGLDPTPYFTIVCYTLGAGSLLY